MSFTYPGRKHPALEAVDLELAAGESVALVGPSGAGKSTLASLLLRLATPAQGRLLVDDVDLAACDPQAWRSRLARLPQRPAMLLRTTVAGNIRLGDPGATVDRLYTAAALAGADRFVRGLPDAYETVVGDGGRPLSPGQIRRIGLARAFLRNAPLLILDEPTVDLDPESAEIVGDAIDRFLGQCTLLLITHREGLAARCDRVVRLELGDLVEPIAEAVA